MERAWRTLGNDSPAFRTDFGVANSAHGRRVGIFPVDAYYTLCTIATIRESRQGGVLRLGTPPAVTRSAPGGLEEPGAFYCRTLPLRAHRWSAEILERILILPPGARPSSGAAMVADFAGHGFSKPISWSYFAAPGGTGALRLDFWRAHIDGCACEQLNRFSQRVFVEGSLHKLRE
jgi:hypothetical protein